MATFRRLALGAAALGCAAAFGMARAAEPVATFSIVGYDPETKEPRTRISARSRAIGGSRR